MKERDYDVIVYGAGPEGVAAALAAADRSARTLLADYAPDVGGSAGCGLVNAWRGEADSALMERVRRLTKRAWGKMIFEPEELSRALRELLAAARVDVLTGASLSKVKLSVGSVRSVTLAAPQAKAKLSAWCFVDATQEYALARRALCCFDEEEEESSLSLFARIGGIDTRVEGVFDAREFAQFEEQFRAEKAVEELPVDLEFPELTPCLRGGTAILNPAPRGLRLGEGVLARAACESKCRDAVYAAIGFLQRNAPGYENCHLIHFATQPVFTEHAQPLRRRSVSLALEGGSASLEDIPAFFYCDPRRPEELVNVPVGNLLCRDAENLLLARAATLSCDALPLLAASGETAGKIAAESVLYDGSVSKLDPERLRKALIV